MKIFYCFISLFNLVQSQDLPNLPIPICSGTAEVVNDTLYFFGGGSRWYLSTERYQAVYKFDGNDWIIYDSIPDNNTWGIESVAVDNDVYLFAGHKSGSRLVRKYNVPEKTWTYLNLSPNLLTFGSSFVYANNHIYLLQRSGDVYEYDMMNDAWQKKTPNSIPGFTLTSAVYQNEIYVIGFYDSTFSHPFYKYSPSTDAWHQLADIPYQVSKCAVQIIDDKIYCAGGSLQGTPSTQYNSLLVYDIVKDTWTIDKFKLSSKRVWMADVIYDGHFLTIGGLDSTGWAVDIVEEVIPIGEAVDVQEQNTFPQNFMLSQNYPNPFNPTTKIEFTVPEVVSKYMQHPQTTIRVYDMLGREVAILVNAQKQPGTYEITFNGSDLSSGIYYYQMKSGSFTITKKMVLLK